MRIIPRGELAARLKAARQASPHTQSSLAAQLQVQQSAISAWEKGDYEPERERWGDIAKALGQTFEELFFYSADEEAALSATDEQDPAA